MMYSQAPELNIIKAIGDSRVIFGLTLMAVLTYYVVSPAGSYLICETAFTKPITAAL
jgi:hypothetical protein